jgi:hypothetical protein
METQTSSSILFVKPAALATMATVAALEDLKVFFASLQVWNAAEPPTVFVYCDRTVYEWLKQVKYSGVIYKKPFLEPYTAYNRQQMEAQPSRKGLPNLFYDFTQEKCSLMTWALTETISSDAMHEQVHREERQGVLFCDADITWLGPVPMIPKTATLALSPHMIRNHDEAKFGIYNAGFLWMNDLDLPGRWEEACKTSRFFEQAALETLDVYVAKDDPELVYLFGPQHNYGWWRLYQGPLPLEKQKEQWTIKRDSKQYHSGLCVQGQPLSCVHTHWKTTDFVTAEFNSWIKQRLSLLKSQGSVKKLLSFL